MDSVWLVEAILTLENNIRAIYELLWVNIGLTSFALVVAFISWATRKED